MEQAEGAQTLQRVFDVTSYQRLERDGVAPPAGLRTQVSAETTHARAVEVEVGTDDIALKNDEMGHFHKTGILRDSQVGQTATVLHERQSRMADVAEPKLLRRIGSADPAAQSNVPSIEVAALGREIQLVDVAQSGSRFERP